MQTKYKIIIFAVWTLLVYAAGFFTWFGITRKRALEFSNDRITSIETRNDSIREGITELSNSELVTEQGIRNSKDGVERSISIVDESTGSNSRAIDVLESANERIERIEHGLNELYKLQLKSEEEK